MARADARHRASAAAAVEATVDNLKLLGEETARKLIGPRGYRRGEEDDEDGKDEASRDAVKLRWGALFKLAKGSSEGPSGDTKDEIENGDVSEKERAAALRALKDVAKLTDYKELHRLEPVMVRGSAIRDFVMKIKPQSMDNVALPSGLHSLTFGERFKQSMHNVALPSGLHLSNVAFPAFPSRSQSLAFPGSSVL